VAPDDRSQEGDVAVVELFEADELVVEL